MSRGSALWLRAEAFTILISAFLVFWDNYDRLAVFPVWAMVLILLAPDLSMIGYAFGPRIGAATYNAAHIYAAPVLLGAASLAFAGADRLEHILAAALLWIMHIAGDRVLGYGLKEITGFRDTHLGSIGRRH